MRMRAVACGTAAADPDNSAVVDSFAGRLEVGDGLGGDANSSGGGAMARWQRLKRVVGDASGCSRNLVLAILTHNTIRTTFGFTHNIKLYRL